jgi:Leucine-rich repeat (LRR) protein
VISFLWDACFVNVSMYTKVPRIFKEAHRLLYLKMDKNLISDLDSFSNIGNLMSLNLDVSCFLFSDKRLN